ncbi:MAG: type II toxin-antitoxin system HigB family toxin [Aureispira sp.]
MTKSSLDYWLHAVKNANWNAPQDILSPFNSADILGNHKGENSSRVVFNISGNDFRMICYYQFGKNKVRLYIKWIGTHAAYTKLCNQKKQYTINIY